VLDANLRAGTGDAIDEMEVIEAHEHVAEARVQEARARRAAVNARAGYDTALAAEKARRQTLVNAAACEAAARFDAKVQALTADNVDLALLDEARRQLNGGGIAAPLAWTELMPSTPSFQSRLEAWRNAHALEFLTNR
jgi:hypothetical protein